MSPERIIGRLRQPRPVGRRVMQPSGPAARRGDHDLNPGVSRPDGFAAAAVLVPLIRREAGLTVLLTRRTDHLTNHAGQVAFPGGRAEEGEHPHETALRETQEEIGLAREHIEILGHLDTYETRTGFEVTPVIGLVAPPFALCADPYEVADIFEVPLSFILDPLNHERHSGEFGGITRTFYVLPYQDRYIWGATAGMLVNLYEVLSANP